MTKESRYDRCPTCSVLVSRRCIICGGSPDPAHTIEAIARGVAEVDRAVARAERARRMNSTFTAPKGRAA